MTLGIENVGYREGMLPSIEIAGHSVKCIVSNIRERGLPWTEMQVINGLGLEGDLVLIEVEDFDSSQVARRKVENQRGEELELFPGDKIVAVLGNRFSGTSECGGIPEKGIGINNATKLDLLATGGIVGIVAGIPKNLGREVMHFRTIGLLSHEGEIVNLADICGPWDERLSLSAPIILIVGTSAEVGKTTTSAALIRELTKRGIVTAGTKIAGTGRMRDIRSLEKAGAYPALDFPDVGLASTYTAPERYTPAIYTLFKKLNFSHPQIIIAEAGGDPIEANIPTFLEDENFLKYIEGIVVVAGDVMGMMGTIDYLGKLGVTKPLYLTYPKNRNPVSTNWRVEAVLPGIPIFDPLDTSETSTIVDKILNQKGGN